MVKWLADFVTLLNAVAGMSAIMLALSVQYDYAFMMLIVALLMDGLDGLVARWMGSSKLGKQLDSLADIISFGVAPAVLAMNVSHGYLTAIAGVIFVASGVLRLARFNVTEWKGYFVGVPIPWSAVVFPLMYWFSAPAIWYAWALLVLAILMNAPFKVKKPSELFGK